MPNDGFSVGRDVTLQISIPGGALVIPADNITNFESKPNAEIKPHIPITGLVQPVLFHLGWDGSFEVTRKSPEIDTFWAQQESNYYAGINQEGGTITETITEADGSLSQFIYTNVVIKLDNAGAWRGNEFVNMMLSFVAARRQKLV